MSNPYPILTYRGDMSKAEDVAEGNLFGWDEAGRLYEIQEVEVYHLGDPAFLEADQGEMFCGMCERADTHTHLRLQYATGEALKEQLQTYALQMRMRGLA